MAMDTSPIDRFLDALPRIEPDQLRRMRQAWDLADAGARQETWKRATRALKAAGREQELDDVREAVSRWVGDAAPGVNSLVTMLRQTERDDSAARVGALPAILDAALAIVAVDLLDQDQRYALAKPWRTGISGEWSRSRRRPGAQRPTQPG